MIDFAIDLLLTETSFILCECFSVLVNGDFSSPIKTPIPLKCEQGTPRFHSLVVNNLNEFGHSA